MTWYIIPVHPAFDGDTSPNYQEKGLAIFVGFDMQDVMKRRSKVTTKKPLNDLSVEETLDHRKIILLEDIQSKMELVIEKATSTEASLTAKIDETKRELGWRLNVVEKVVAELSHDMKEVKSDVNVLKSDVNVLKSDVNVLKSDVNVLKSDINVLKSDVNVLKSDVKEIKTTVNRLDERFNNHETRLTVMEGKIEIHPSNHS